MAARRPPDDFPAAHSMDTHWFAVDADGHVAVFETEACGAVPVDADLGERPEVVDELILASVPHSLARLVPPEPRPFERHAPQFVLGHDDVIYYALTREAADRIASLTGAPVERATTGFAIPVHRVEADVHRRIHETKTDCDRCERAWLGDARPSLADHGVYLFRHVEENDIANPYVPVAAPGEPARFDALPEEVRARLVRYPGRFAALPKIQPVEHWPVRSWGAAYLSADGLRVRPIPGAEDAFLTEMAAYRPFHFGGVDVHPRPPGWDDPPPGTASTTRPTDPQAADPSASAGAREPVRRPWWKLW